MGAFILQLLTPIVMSYLRAFAAKEVIDYVLDSVLQAAVDSTKTNYDNDLLDLVRKHREKQ